MKDLAKPHPRANCRIPGQTQWRLQYSIFCYVGSASSAVDWLSMTGKRLRLTMPIDVNGDSDLCLSCGLCCTGMLHRHVLLEREEVALARSLGLEVVESGKPVFMLPCARFEGCCSIYDERPQSCRAFRCALLQRLDSGEIDIVSAEAIVAEAQRLIGAAQEALPAGEVVAEFRGKVGEGASALCASTPPEQRLRLTALGVYLDKHFVRAKDNRFFQALLVGAAEDKKVGHAD